MQPASINETQNAPAKNLSYVLITAARNEEAFIEQTILSVVNQSILPLKWVIVSDGSTDKTDEIVKRHAEKHPWIQLIRMPEREERNFAGKAYAFNAGYEKIRNLDFDFIGSVDADISFDSYYFQYLFSKFDLDPQLGVAGTPFREGDVQYDYRFSRKEHVSGACQLFRKDCFESIGGYLPLKTGAVDLTAVVSARMKGWKTETFTDKVCMHHRKMGSAKNKFITATFKSGYYDYPMGVHPVWQICRSLYQMSRRPIIIGGTLLLAGYFWALVKQVQTPVSGEFVEFRRKEQMKWLKEYFLRVVFCKHSAS